MSPMEYPLANPPMYGDSDYESRGGRIISMSPDEYLSHTPELTLDDETQDNIEDLANTMKQGREIDPPTLYLDADRVVGHDGRHRAYAAKELGMTEIPVLLIDKEGNPAQSPIRENRELGKSLADQKGPGMTQIYRAVANDVSKFKDRDYVTLSLKFAVEHAENNNIVYDDTHHVITTIVNNDQIFDASNPGEYFYSGPEKEGRIKYTSKGYEYEGWDELNKSDFIFESVRMIVRETIEKMFENKLVQTGNKTFSDGEIYHMTGDDEYIHFTSPDNARKIFNDRKLSVPGDSSVFAISLTYGSHTPGVQTDRLAEPVAILFTTDKKPKSGFSDEVTWTGDVPLKTAEVIPYDRALKMLDDAPEKIDGDDSVVYESIINEAKSKFDKLQDNKIPLTDDERAEVMKKKATWNHGPNGKPSPAVWKSKNKKGDITYITHTHRAYNTAKSLGAAINKYHNFIKGTS